MNRNKSIQLKAAFLLIVFSLNTVIGFACAVGLDMGFNSHHHEESAIEVTENHHHNKSHHHDEADIHHHQTNNNKDNCCNDEVMKFQQVDKKYSDIDYSDLNGYFLLLNEQIPSEQVEYHHENLMKIINLWASQNFNAMDNYLEVREDLKKLIEETDRLANDGMKQIEETL